jgi:hypothetical protein
MCPYSSVVEHCSCKPGVVSSNLTGGNFFHHYEILIYVQTAESIDVETMFVYRLV